MRLRTFFDDCPGISDPLIQKRFQWSATVTIISEDTDNTRMVAGAVLGAALRAAPKAVPGKTNLLRNVKLRLQL